ncbi:ChbG/HpnK family deacetylase [Cohnella sp. CFH 77786]|uniref:polysaccharide deacetylase family protein n=1 Tax=Cohnella sp. CFH 77786 TaxID=2662265 RepID=UPI001C60D910|nr:polysaccharide deacetylase family protein [Cohnella sp. CFH 77786]MBW5448136.1 ChbG/HpnK family deacetylase [Cohnella sp. CFH 77786]
MNTSERLGYGKEEKLLIVNADDFGLSRSVNDGVLDLLVEGAVSSATVMMNCPWSSDAAAKAASLPDADIGVHWTLTSEWPAYRWGPLVRSRPAESLCGKDGWFPLTSEEVERRADPEEVRFELIAQTEAALRSGLALTHADNHLGSLYGLATGRDLLHVAFEVCARYGLPFRLPRKLIPVGGRQIPQEMLERAKIRARQAEDYGIVLPDYVTGPEYRLLPGETYDDVKAEGIALLRGLLPGVTEWIAHPARLTDELKSFHQHPEKRGMERSFWTDPDVKSVLRQEQIRLIGWKELQRLQSSLSA